MSKKHNKRAQPGAGKSHQQAEDPRLVQGRNAFARADYGQAIHLWERLAGSPALQPDKREALHRALAEAHFRVGQRLLFENPREAIQHLARAVELAPTDALYAYHLGLAYHRQGNPKLATEWYQQALQRDANFPRAKAMLTLAEKPAGVWKLDTARETITQFQPVFGAGNAQLLVDAQQAAEGGAWAAAATALSSLNAQELPFLAQGVAFYYQGVAAQRQGESDKAYGFWSKAFDAGLKTPALLENLTNSLLPKAETELAANNLEQANKLIQHGLQVSPGHKRLLEMKAHLQLQQGYASAEAGNWQAALAIWSNSADLSGENARAALVNSAIGYEKLEAWSKAAEAWREFARRRPRLADSEGWLAPEQVARLWERISGLYMRAENPDEAVKTLLTALKYEPDNPRLLLALARCYVDAERSEAAQNQLDKLLAQDPHNIEALVLRATVTEMDPRRSYRQREFDRDLISVPPGLPEWEAVMAENDETYRALAEERLIELYDQALHNWFFILDLEAVKMVGERALKYLPNNHFMRAIYVQALLKVGDPGRAEAMRQIEHIDLTDDDALHQLIDGFHGVKAHPDAATLLQKAEALKPLDAEFYAGVGNCALRREQVDIAERYFDEALKRCTTEQERLAMPLLIGMAYLEVNQFDKAEAFLSKMLAADAHNGPAHFVLALLADRRGDRAGARRHLREAEKGADRVADPSFLETVRAARQLANVPYMNLWEMFRSGPASMDFGDEDFSEFDEADDFDNFLPTRGRRRR